MDPDSHPRGSQRPDRARCRSSRPIAPNGREPPRIDAACLPRMDRVLAVLLLVGLLGWVGAC